MQTKHTPGPWKPTALGNYVQAPDFSGIAKLSTREGNADEQAANARLIASAPDLLAALVALVGEADLGEIDHDDDTRAMLAQARAAIARATGE